MIEGNFVLGLLVNGFLTRLAVFLAIKFFILRSAPPSIKTLATLFGLVHFKDLIEGDLVFGFLADGFLTRLAIFSAVNFFILESALSFTKTLITLFGLVPFKDWIEGDLVLGFLVDGFPIRLTIFLAVNFFVLGSVPSFKESLVTLFGLVRFRDWIEGDLV